MKIISHTIQILVIIQLIGKVLSQVRFNNGDILRYKQMVSNDGQIETITNLINRDPSSQAVGSVSLQYHTTDDANKNEEYNRAEGRRSRKLYRIKTPFQQQVEDIEKQDGNTDPRDSETGASNQAVQYSLPPEEFMQQTRAENQYYQQQQLSTPAPSFGYTVTPQPQYQYSTMPPPNNDNTNQQSNQLQHESKVYHTQAYPLNFNYPYSASNIYSFQNMQSTPSPVYSYVSTSLPNNQYGSSPSNSYVTTTSPIFLSSPSNLQQYVSTPLSAIQVSSSPDYNNRVTSTISSLSLNYDNNDPNKKMQIDHYDNAANGIRHPNNGQQQFQNDYSHSTPSPSSSPYSNSIQESWQNTMNAGINALSKSLQEVSLTQYKNNPYNNNQQYTRSDWNADSTKGDIHRVGNIPSANHAYTNITQPEFLELGNFKSQTKNADQESGQPELYSNGDYGWRLTGQKPTNHDTYTSGNYPQHAGLGFQSNGGAVSQTNFQLDTSKPYNYNQASKHISENAQSQEFAKAAAKAHESFKQTQLYGNNYASFHFGVNTNQPAQNGHSLYGNNDKQKSRHPDSSNTNLYTYGNSQGDLITASPYYYINLKENSVDSKSNLPFDHAKALKNIVPIDVSNVVPNLDVQMKAMPGFEGYRQKTPNFEKAQDNQNLKQYYQPLIDSYYKDQNTIYGFNIKTKPNDFLTIENFKELDPNLYYHRNPQQYREPTFSSSGISQSLGYTPQVSSNYQDNIQLPANFQQQGLQRPRNQISPDIASIFKLNDGPYKLTQGSSSEALMLHNNNFDQSTTPLPMNINQNLGSHQLDVTTGLLNKLMLNQQAGLNANRPEIGSLSTINGFKVANPYNFDPNLVTELLRGKPTLDEAHILSSNDQFNKPSRLKLDLSQLQLLLRNEENSGNIGTLTDSRRARSNPYLDVYSNGRFPYQGVKYSRSQEEEESLIPLADTSNTHPIGAVMEQDDTASDREVSTGSDAIAEIDKSIADSFDEDRSKKTFTSSYRAIRDRHQHSNALQPGRSTYQRKYPKSHFGEPYPLLKPPPYAPRSRDSNVKIETFNRRQRVNKPRAFRALKNEPLYEADSDTESNTAVPILLKPPPVAAAAEAKSDIVENERNS